MFCPAEQCPRCDVLLINIVELTLYLKEPAYYGRVGPLVDWIYKYVERNKTCFVDIIDSDRAGSDTLTLSLNIPPGSLFENKSDGSISSLQIFGILLVAFISTFILIVVGGLLWKKNYIRIDSHSE